MRVLRGRGVGGGGCVARTMSRPCPALSGQDREALPEVRNMFSLGRFGFTFMMRSSPLIHPHPHPRPLSSRPRGHTPLRSASPPILPDPTGDRLSENKMLVKANTVIQRGRGVLPLLLIQKTGRSAGLYSPELERVAGSVSVHWLGPR